MRLRKPCVIIGCGQHASSVISILEDCVEGYDIVGLVDSARSYDPDETNGEYRVIMTLDDLLSTGNASQCWHCVLAIGDGGQRSRVFSQLNSAGFNTPNITSRHAFVDRSVVMGSGNIIAHNAVINAGVHLGDNNLINTGVIVEHHCSLGSHNHLAPRSLLCGGVGISDLAFVGAGAVVAPKVKIAEGVILGAGATLLGSVDTKGEVLTGVPARAKKK